MKTIMYGILLLILLLFSGCNKNKTEHRVEQRVDEDGYLIEKHFADSVFYYYKLFYPSGKLAYEVSVANDLPDGTETEYYENGVIKMQGTRINNIEAGWYSYYNINQQTDSVIEYIPINTDNYLGLFFRDDNEYIQNAAMRNRHLIYKNGEIDAAKSLYFDVSLNKDTVLLGDTIRGYLNFINRSNNQPSEFIVFTKTEPKTTLYVRFYSGGRQDVHFFFVPPKRGQQMLEGMKSPLPLVCNEGAVVKRFQRL